jgi:hypothetical protein
MEPSRVMAVRVSSDEVSERTISIPVGFSEPVKLTETSEINAAIVD